MRTGLAPSVVSQEYMRIVLCPAGLQTRRESHCHAGRSEDHPATEYASYFWDDTLGAHVSRCLNVTKYH